jgi:hypothetical protein
MPRQLFGNLESTEIENGNGKSREMYKAQGKTTVCLSVKPNTRLSNKLKAMLKVAGRDFWRLQPEPEQSDESTVALV